MQNAISPLVKRILGTALLALGLFYVVYAGFELVSPAPDRDWLNTLFMMTFLGMAPALGGLWLIRRANRENKLYYQRYVENRVLRLIKRLHRDITATDLAQEMNWTTEEAQKVLQELEIKGVLTSQVDQEGRLLYNIY